MKAPRFSIGFFPFVLLFMASCSGQQTAIQNEPTLFNVDTVRAGEFDTGKMWTFDYPPTDYFKRTYGFTPGADWFENARLASLRLPNCSASFVSEDGLVFTNHHCARSALDAVNREGENLPDLGFYAPTLADERKVPQLYVDQLVLIEDVTAEVVSSFESGSTDEDRVMRRTAKIEEIEKQYSEKTGLRCNVITFYNGGRFSVYGYKRFNDVRIVFAPELAIAFFGGDYDNFTYPRYDLDISYFRVYDDEGKPLKTKNFFKWSTAGAREGEPVFVIGNPGRTSRLFTVSQLEFNRDHAYPFVLERLNELVEIYTTLLQKHPDLKLQFQTRLFSFTNSQKVYVGRIEGLHDPVIKAKKRDFEKKFRNAVAAKPALHSQYEAVWTEIAAIQKEKAALFGQVQALNFTGVLRPSVLSLANSIVEYASAASLPPAEQAEHLRGATLEALKEKILGTDVTQELDAAVLTSYLRWASTFLGGNKAFNDLLGGMTPEKAASALMETTILSDNERLQELMGKSPQDILSSTDPFIAFVSNASSHARNIRAKYADAGSREQARVQTLGKALYEVYGTSIPPDATFTLRIADGVVQNYEYNGTVAPVYTTFYGLYDRYFSFEKSDPWLIPDTWKNPPSTFDMSTKFNFISTNDIIGGNSGSPVLSRDLQVVGIAFDGNIESLPGDFIFDETKNRCVSVHSAGILEALEDIYKAERTARELRAGKIQ
ncbi:MAG TPA: S46 family peptidase [Bacteroidota bacterium]